MGTSTYDKSDSPMYPFVTLLAEDHHGIWIKIVVKCTIVQMMDMEIL